LRWATKAWRNGVTETTIANCWLKSRVLSGQMTPLIKWQAQEMKWSKAIEQDEANYNDIINTAREAIKELEKQQFIKEGQHIAAYLNPPDEVIDDAIDDNDLLEQIAQSYARGPESDLDGPDVPLPEPISVSQALDAVRTLRAFAEQQQEDKRGLISQLASLEREAKAQQASSRTQSTLDRFFVDAGS